MNLITMVHVMGIKESVEAKLHCRNIAGFPGPHSCHSEFRHQNHPCLKPYNMPGWPGYNVTQCANNVIQTLPALIYLILQKDEGFWLLLKIWKEVFTPGLECKFL